MQLVFPVQQAPTLHPRAAHLQQHAFPVTQAPTVLAAKHRVSPVQQAPTIHPPAARIHQHALPVQQVPTLLAVRHRAPPVQQAPTIHSPAAHLQDVWIVAKAHTARPAPFLVYRVLRGPGRTKSARVRRCRASPAQPALRLPLLEQIPATHACFAPRDFTAVPRAARCAVPAPLDDTVPAAVSQATETHVHLERIRSTLQPAVTLLASCARQGHTAKNSAPYLPSRVYLVVAASLHHRAQPVPLSVVMWRAQKGTFAHPVLAPRLHALRATSPPKPANRQLKHVRNAAPARTQAITVQVPCIPCQMWSCELIVD